MTLSIIGIGLATEKDISVKGLAFCQGADKIYLESYTNVLQVPIQRLESLYGRHIIVADRTLVEQKAEQTILKDAQDHAVCFLVIGDVFSATTHTDLYLRAVELGIEVNIVHNASIFSAIGQTGLQVYKFGKTTSIPFLHHNVSTPYQYLEQNKSIGAHTLFLLDLDPIDKKFLAPREALQYLLDQEHAHGKNLVSKETNVITCARLGADNAQIRYASIEEHLNSTKTYGNPPYCIIVPGDMHFMEEEAVEHYRPQA